MVGETSTRIAIVGFGPRGLGSLEALVRQALTSNKRVDVDLFEPGDWPAAGPNFSPDETAVCQLNLPLRSVDLPSPPGGNIGSFAAWLGTEGSDQEAYVARARLGAYLNARLGVLLSSLPDHIVVTIHPAKVTSAMPDGRRWSLVTDGGEHGPFDHVLMSLGQPGSRADDQLARWRAHADRHGLALSATYPGTFLIKAAEDWTGKVVGIRGLALSALDAVRLLTLGLGGRFEGARYIHSGREPARILPFSLDGQAPAPKPLNAALDARFDPQLDETAAFKAALCKMPDASPDDTFAALGNAIATATCRVIRVTGGAVTTRDVHSWLQMERDCPGSQEKRNSIDALRRNVAMAEGEAPPDIGYSVGQLWRKWQPELRSIFNDRLVDAETAVALLGFDEGLKRFSYGAPVSTLRQLLALIEHDLVELRAADDPDIKLTSDGWRFDTGDVAITVNAMVDSVLPQPDWSAVTDPLPAGLRKSAGLAPIAAGLGAHCTPDTVLVRQDGSLLYGVELAGRLASGSFIACDSIHDCFGETCDRWAKMVLRHD